MKRTNFINLATFFSIVLGLLLLFTGLLLARLEIVYPAVVLILISGIISLITNELIAIRKTLDRLDRGQSFRG